MAINPADLLFQEYTRCADPGRSEALLEKLIVDHAQPGIQKIIRYKLSFQGAAEAQDIEDVASEVLVELIGRLRSIKGRGANEPSAGGDGVSGTSGGVEGTVTRSSRIAGESIGAFSGYTAVAAYHACNEYLRRKYPNRHRLKTGLRYLLNNEKNLAIWETDAAEWLCGTRKWMASQVSPAPKEAINSWREIVGVIPHGRSAMHPADLLTRIFERFGSPLPFDELVNIVSQIWGVDDPPAAPEKAARDLESGEPDPAERMDLKRWLSELWAQILLLPGAQRQALLLNLRTDLGAPAASLLPVTGIASIREIAGILDYPLEEFAEVWNRLPLDDLAIGQRLGVTRQQVINLRKSARERLIRRIGGKYRLS
jgi:hypothetical protein